ncbi:N-terminal glutamine amidase-domain-containing protein [Gloeopeniophorella convolvens]|nr:N-terminal glutamine amidase-domain-containing protein [Gloeopeniophorella convolvens]
MALELPSHAQNSETQFAVNQPPALPINALYTRNYCEENIYLLARDFTQGSVGESWNAFAVFISNHTRSVALWNQRARDGVVVWDYHVILALQPKPPYSASGVEPQDISRPPTTWIYDFDTRLDLPCLGTDYIFRSFDLSGTIPEQYHSCFRVVTAAVFLDRFASDRSHMMVTAAGSASSLTAHGPLLETVSVPDASEQDYLSPPPAYPPLCGPGAMSRSVRHNLMSDFVDMSAESVGVVLNLGEFAFWCSSM